MIKKTVHIKIIFEPKKKSVKKVSKSSSKKSTKKSLKKHVTVSRKELIKALEKAGYKVARVIPRPPIKPTRPIVKPTRPKAKGGRDVR